MIAVAGIDMAAWDALARAAGVPLCVLLGGSIGPVPAYNSNGLWLRSPTEVASEAVELREEGGFQGLKLRLGRERLADDLTTVEAVREAVGSEMSLMVDFNQGLHLGEALERCHAIDDLGLAWIEEPIVYDNLEGYTRLTADLKTPVQIGENFYGPRALYTALQMKACDTSCRISCGSAASQAGNEQPPSRQRRAFPFPPISIPRWPPTSCGSAKRRTGSSGKIGQIRFCSSPMRSKMASCLFRTCRVSGWNGTRRQSPLTWPTTFKRPIFLAVNGTIATTVGRSEMRERPPAKAKSLRI
jgi:Enolase C-terminal domain-like/Mandelate racemase / muconate lactonizing enzyme, N-terminal domain